MKVRGSMRKNMLLVDAYMQSSNWIGGLYYRKNIIYSLLQNKNLMNKYHIVLFVSQNDYTVFEEFKKNIIIISTDKRLSERSKKIFLIKLSLKYHIKYIFPTLENRILSLFGINCIAWIPDFQHFYFPYLFEKSDLENRTRLYQRVIENSKLLILSSHNALNDVKKFYSHYPTKTEVVPFISDLNCEIHRMNPQSERKIIVKYGLEGTRYICVCNQFWQHKNHVLVLNAIERLIAENRADIVFVFTGELKDYRNTEYFEKIKAIISRLTPYKCLKILGFINRFDQIVIMKHAEFIVQPSLFEGWGTVLEDAKVLDKTVLLSDIPIHREQKNERCILFDPYDADALARLIVNEYAKIHDCEDVEKGLADMTMRAQKYSAGFERMLLVDRA